MAILKAAVVGCGGRGRGHIKELVQFEDVDVVALCDPVAESGASAGAEFGIEKRYQSSAALLEGEQLDVAFVATPAHLNAQEALLFLNRGIHTLLEKPPGLNNAETRGLRDAARRNGVKSMVGWNRRFHPVIVEARRLVEERGPIVQMVGEFHKSMAGFVRSARFPEIIMDNMMFESPIHAIDILREMGGGEVHKVHSVVGRMSSRYKDMHAALIEFENGCVAQFSANYTTDARLERYELHGHGISAYLEGIHGGEVVCDGTRHNLEVDVASGGTREQARYFLDCIQQDMLVARPAADLDEAVKTIELCEEIMQGLRQD